MKMKETLDYYAYHDKFKFDFACEVSSREIFEDSLQPILSEIMDGIDFFTEKTTYVAAKQHLAMFRSSRTKVLSFTKSFLIKLFNKEDSFQRGNDKVSLLGCVDSYYPKSKIKFVLCYLCHFPQFQG